MSFERNDEEERSNEPVIRDFEQIRQLRNDRRVGSLSVSPELRKQKVPPDLSRVVGVGSFGKSEDLGEGSGVALLVRGGKGRTASNGRLLSQNDASGTKNVQEGMTHVEIIAELALEGREHAVEGRERRRAVCETKTKGTKSSQRSRSFSSLLVVKRKTYLTRRSLHRRRHHADLLYLGIF